VGIQDDDVRKVRDTSDIVAIVTQYTPLKRVGRRWVGLCPFHSENSPSFSVNGEEGLYYCFGCGAKGDVITFVREKEGLDFVGSVELLAKKAGVQLTYTDAHEGKERARRTTLVEAMRKAVAWYHDRLLTGDDAGAARSYLRSRGFDGETVRRYQVGWAPDSWDDLARALKLPKQDLEDSGLGFVNRRNRVQDSFRSRVLFPIFDVQGDPVGFGGRILPGGEGPKYKNSSDGPLYAKSRVLYGLNWAKADVVNSGEVVVCEGYTDVIGMAQAGVPRGVATCGTALTEEHIRLMKRYAPRVVLAFDADAAGQNAAERFYEWERKYEVEVYVAGLPPGVDPGDLAQKDPSALAEAVTPASGERAPLRLGRQSIEGAVPFLEFRLRRALAATDGRSVESRARTAEVALQIINQHPSEIVREGYADQVADALQLSVDQMRGFAQRGARSATRQRAPQRAPELTDARTEIEALRHYAEGTEGARDEIHAVLFAGGRTHAAFVALRDSDDIHAAIEAADPGAQEVLMQIAAHNPVDSLLDTVSDLLRARLAEAAAEIEYEVATVDVSDEAFPILTGERRYVALEQMRLARRETDGEERGELVAFLVERSERLGPPADASPEELLDPERSVENEPVEAEAPPPPDPGEEMG
jgi:DNA primase